MKIYAVAVNRDDTVSVVSVTVDRETPQYYFCECIPSLRWDDPRRAFGYGKRIIKERAFISERAALEAYMARRQRDKANAQGVVGQATKQIASANELLMKLPPVEEGKPQNAEATTVGEG